MTSRPRLPELGEPQHARARLIDRTFGLVFGTLLLLVVAWWQILSHLRFDFEIGVRGTVVALEGDLVRVRLSPAVDPRARFRLESLLSGARVRMKTVGSAAAIELVGEVVRIETPPPGSGRGPGSSPEPIMEAALRLAPGRPEGLPPPVGATLEGLMEARPASALELLGAHLRRARF